MSANPINHFQCYFLTETAVTVKFGQAIDDKLFEEISQFNQLLLKKPFEGMLTTVQAYTTLTVYYNPLLVFKSNLNGKTCYDNVVTYLHHLKQQTSEQQNLPEKKVEIPVCYDGVFGLDLFEIAAHSRLSVEEVIEIHSTAVYKVHLIGFVPGFAYLGGMDERLAMPRKATPRKEVPMGSVGIAGKQTGIYPLTTPGGWQILGRTPLTLFSLKRDQASSLKPGDLVSFKRIDQNTFTALTQSIDADSNT